MLEEDELEGTGTRVEEALPAEGFTFVPTFVSPICETELGRAAG